MPVKTKKGKPTRPKSPPAELPESVEVMLGPSQAAAALGMKASYFLRQVKLGTVPKPDGVTPWGKRNFWKKSTINKYIESLTNPKPVEGS